MRKVKLVIGIIFVALGSSLMNIILETLYKVPPPDKTLDTNNVNLVVGDSGDRLTWWVHITDLHISMFHAPDRTEDLAILINELLEYVRPPVIVVTGDLTDAKDPDYSGSRQYKKEWEHYSRIVNMTTNTTTQWLDIRGNHDNFDVPDLKDDSNMFSTYSSQGRQGHLTSYYHKVDHNGVKLAFIAVDATLKPGPRRPFNFVGALTKIELDQLEQFTREANMDTEGIVWFGHYPTSVIISPSPGIRSVMSQGLVYLCGHLHNLHGLGENMIAKHGVGLRELELTDWKDNRMFRLMAVDHGLMSWVDVSTVSHPTWPVVLVTWPPKADILAGDREPLYLLHSSTHIRLLVFSVSKVLSVTVKIDNGEVLGCTTRDGRLYTAPWNPSYYSQGLHVLNVNIETEFATKELTDHVFSLSEQRLEIPLIGRVVLLFDLISTFQFLFISLIAVSVLPLTFVKLSYNLGPLYLLQPLVSLPILYYLLVLIPLYMCIGPWFLGEILTGHYGFVFVWGTIIVSPSYSYLPTATTYLYGIYHLITTHIPLVLSVSILLHTRLNSTMPLLLPHLLILPLTLHQVYLTYSLYLAYGWISLFGPYRAGYLCITLICWIYGAAVPTHKIYSVDTKHRLSASG